MPNIPPQGEPRWKDFFSPVLYRDRNAVNFLASVCIAATLGYRL